MDVSDMMRRLVKEDLLLGPTAPDCSPSDARTPFSTHAGTERHLYVSVTDYVREQFNLANRLVGQGWPQTCRRRVRADHLATSIGV